MDSSTSVLRRCQAIAILVLALFLLMAGAQCSAKAADPINYLYTTGNSPGIHVFSADDGALITTLSSSGICNVISARGDGKSVYVADGDFITAIDTSLDTPFATVSYPGASSHISAMVVGSDNNLYIADSYQKCIHIYAPDLTLVQSISANPGLIDPFAEGYLPVFIAVSPDASLLYAGCAYGLSGDAAALSSNDYSLLIFDANTGERLSVLGLHTADGSGNAAPDKYRLASMAISSAGDYLWLGVYRSDATGRPIDSSSQLMAMSLPMTDSSASQAMYVPPIPSDIILAPDASQAFVLASSSGEGGIVAYDARGFQVARLYTVNNVNMRHGALAPDVSRLYVSTAVGYSIVEIGSGTCKDIITPCSVDMLVVVKKALAPTLEPTTPTPFPVTASPTLMTVTVTPVESTAMPLATPSPTPACVTPTYVPLPSPDQGSWSDCLRVPAIGIGCVIVLGPLANTLRKRRLL